MAGDPRASELERTLREARGPVEVGRGSQFLGDFRVKGELTLSGAGATATPVFGRSEGDWIEVPAAARLHLVDLALRRQGPPGAADVLVVEGFARLERCRIEGALLRDGRGGVGLRVRGGGRVELVDCVITRCEDAALAADDRAVVSVERGALLGRATGVRVEGEASVTLRAVEVSPPACVAASAHLAI